MKKLLILATLLLCCQSINLLNAQTTWNGNTSTDWNTASNWSAGIPTAASDAIIADVANDPIITNGTAALAKSVTVNADAALTINNGGSLTITGSTGSGLENNGATTNHGTITIDNTQGNGILNSGSNAQFTNHATVDVGANQSIGNRGIYNTSGATFTNEVGSIVIDDTGGEGLRNEDANFTNKAIITLGANKKIGKAGIDNLNSSIFINEVNGNISIDDITFSAIANYATSQFTNKAIINIGANKSIDVRGIYNLSGATFTNDTGGNISVDDTAEDGIRNTDSGTNFTNKGTIIIGENKGITGVGFNNSNSAIYTNDDCAILEIYDNLSNDATFINNGFVLLETSETHTVGTLTNDGVISAATSTFTGGTNNEIIANPISSNNGVFNNALEIGGTNSLTIGNQWFTNENLTGTAAGNYDAAMNQFTLTSLCQGTHTVYFNVMDNANSCNFTVSIELTITAAISHTTTTWTGAANSDWDNEANWTNCIPGANTDVTIPNVTTAPIITNGTAALAKSVDVNTDAALSINNGGSLTIAGSTGFGFRNNGTTTNYGTINIDDTQAHGLSNSGNNAQFTNHATINIGANQSIGNRGIYNFDGAIFTNEAGSIVIDDTGGEGLRNKGASFTNKAIFTLGANKKIGKAGIDNLNSSIFINEVNGNISIDDITFSAIANYATSQFTNKAIINIGANKSIDVRGIYNLSGATFTNDTGGNISVDDTAEDGIRNQDSGTNFTNKATIIIGANKAITDIGLNNSNSAIYTNDNCAILEIHDNINNTATIENKGLILLKTSDTHTVGTFTNNGVVSAATSTFTGATNNDVIVNPISINNQIFNNALEIGGTNSFTIGSQWFTNENLTGTVAGTYNNAMNTFTPTTLTEGEHTLYFQVMDNVNSCSRTAQIKVTLTFLPIVSVAMHNGLTTPENSGSLTYRFSLNNSIASDLTINFSIGGTADESDFSVTTNANTTYMPGNQMGTIKILSGQTFADLTVSPINLPIVEMDETVVVKIEAP